MHKKLLMTYPFFLHLIVGICVIFFVMGCESEKDSKSYDLSYKNELEKQYSQLDNPLSLDSLRSLLYQNEKDGHDAALTFLYRKLGEIERRNSDFSEAIRMHRMGLKAAYKINDTIEIIRALNNLGTNCRRLGMLPEAGGYHYNALQTANMYSDQNDIQLSKGRTYALNGIGNISLTINLLDKAKYYFNTALNEAIINENILGQAINYANIGAVYELKKQYDSAYLYYRKSMDKNKEINSKLGISLCHIHFGEIYKNTKQFNKAEAEYKKAYFILEKTSDRWHWLEACLSLAKLKVMTNNLKEALNYTYRAKVVASKINSLEHLSIVHNLLYQCYIDKGDYFSALSEYKLSKTYQDSLQGNKKVNQIIDTRIQYEKEKNKLNIAHLEQQNRLEKKKKNLFLLISILVLLVLGSSFALLFRAFKKSRKSNKILNELEQIRNDFFTKITHEFRTPLTVILGLSRQLKDSKIKNSDSYITYINSIERQGKTLLDLVNQLLDIKRIKMVTDKIEWQTGDILLYIKMLSETFRLYAEEKGINLIVKSNLSEIETDFVPDYINKILQNLLSNAIKHSHKGDSIILEVESGDTLTIRVIDEGEGISKTDKEHIFDLFYQSPQHQRIDGTGIGLNLTKQLVKALNGKIWVESELGKGSTFVVELPLNRENRQNITRWIPDNMTIYPQENKTEIESKHIDNIDMKTDEDVRTTILLVEDNKDVALYIKSLFPENKYIISYAKNGEEGLSIAIEIIPDIIITDIMMPVRDGLEMCQEIRESTLLNHIPIIIITAKESNEDQIQGLKCGADAYLKKPFYAEELKIRVEKLLENRNLLKEKYRRAILKNENYSTKDINLEFLQKVTDIIYKEMQNVEFTPKMLADKLSVSVTQLNKKLKVTTGYPSSSYILQIRIKYAKKLLTSQKYYIGEVASECGIPDVNYFSRVFKKITGVTPSQFKRTSIQNK